MLQLNGIKKSVILTSLMAIILVVAIITIWSWPSTYKPIYSAIDKEEARSVLNELLSNNIDAIFDEAGTIILVPRQDAQKSRALLTNNNFLINFDKKSTYNTNNTYPVNDNSILIERAQIQHDKEVEVARTIASLNAVKSARVHFGIPQEDLSNQAHPKPSASVAVILSKGHDLGAGEISAIVHLVSSSILNLEPEKVTIIDQYGRLLTDEAGRNQHLAPESEYTNVKGIEKILTNRIERILGPIVGTESIRAEVTVDLYSPDLDKNKKNINLHQEAKKNTHNNITITSRLINRLSVAVVVNDKIIPGPSGKLIHIQRTPEEIERLTKLVKDAVGYDDSRGDIVNVFNASFTEESKPKLSSIVSAFDRIWIREWLGRFIVIILVILLAVGMFRPITNLFDSSQISVTNHEHIDKQPLTEKVNDFQDIMEKYNDYLDRTTKVVTDDPKLTAQIIKNWIASDGK